MIKNENKNNINFFINFKFRKFALIFINGNDKIIKT